MTRPKRVGVLTFHRCINYGSYWQARRLVEGLRARGHDAQLLDHRSPRVDRAEWRCALSPHLPAPTPAEDRRAYADKTRAFFDAFGRLPMSKPFDLKAPARMDRQDIVVVGSDEVWNLRHPWYGGEPVFFGQGLNADRIAAYAASVGNHGDAGLDDGLASLLRGFAHISVRDENARRLARGALGLEAPRVLDPCLQFAPPRAASASSGEVIVYGHGFPAWLQRALSAWAGRRGRRLLSFGYRNAWADAQTLDAGPEAFAEAMASASGIVTNFFHGCVFALAERKPFVCVGTPYRADKIGDLLTSLGAEDRLIGDDASPDRIDHLMTTPPEPIVEARIAALRARSDAFLDTALA
ncbi:polysaccharide pyruvyl transferase family protein [uncultured Caulobacter sp.]|uniref:polysaccharide pyruvyl transferase family protein n=1 Tax=uncultured Caulobacter sp. TaxID=158749 RepID=UPI002629E744|nr:polysaccharide pyruvyl transferase family protein [uncultured Caulobacter sp.]